MEWFLVIVSVVVLELAYGNSLKLRGRIVGGETVDIKDFPYQVSVRHKAKHTCGGTIISKNTVLTAGHCTLRGSPMSIAIGSTYANKGDIYEVYEIIQNNPPYDDYTLENDISLLKITPSINFTSTIQPIKLSTKKLAVGAEVITSGWGKWNDSEPKTINFGNRPLQAVTLKVVNNEECIRKYRKFDVELDDRRMCAAAKGKDSCQGDSGGPLVDKKSRELIAVLSLGYKCADPDYAGVYTRVASYINFITGNM